jgi:hypothetical protein
MPQIDFFVEPNDENVLVRLFFQLGFTIVPDICYDEPTLIYVTNLATYEKFRSLAHSFFLWTEECAASPLIMFQVVGTGWNAGKFSIHKRQGGPTLHFVCHPSTMRDGVHIVPAGLVSYYGTYKNTTTSEFEKVPAILRSKYRAIAERIRLGSRKVTFECVEGGIRTYWIMPEALQAVKAGGELGVQRLADLGVKGLEDVPWSLRGK